jgi:tetratricopeptide (TPR) repeat protein
MTQIKCPNCSFELEIIEELKEFKKTICPACNKNINLAEFFGNDFSALETVFVARDEPEQVEIVSLLESSGIGIHLKKVEVQNLIGLGKFGKCCNATSGPVEIQVSENDLEKSGELIQDYLKRMEDQPDQTFEEDEISGEDQDEIDKLFNEGTELFEREEFPLAEAKFQEALFLLPESQEILYNLVLVYTAQKKLDLANKYLEQVDLDDRMELAKEIKKVENSLHEDYCPICKNYKEADGICYELKENIQRYPKRFMKLCGGKFFRKDLDKS